MTAPPPETPFTAEQLEARAERHTGKLRAMLLQAAEDRRRVLAFDGDVQDAAETIIRNRQQFFESEADTAIVRKLNNLQQRIDDLRFSEKKQRTRAERAEQLYTGRANAD